MKKSLLALLFAVALAVPAMAENMWVGGNLGYGSNNFSLDDYKQSSTSWSVEPEFGYSLNEKWDIGLDFEYASKAGVDSIYGISLRPMIGGDTVEAKEMGIAPFVRYHVAKIAGVDVMLKGSAFYAKGEINSYGDSVDYKAYGVTVAPVISYSINETWSIGATLDFLNISYIYAEIDDGSGIKPNNKHFGFNANDGSLISVGFSYHF